MPSLTGVRKLDRKLQSLDRKVQKKLIRSAVNKALTVAKKAIKSEIPSRYPDLRKAIGKRLAKGKTGSAKGITVGKVGAAVGVTAKRRAKNAAKKKPRKRPGVGIGPENAHWFLMGTSERTAGIRKIRVKGGGWRKKLTGNPIHSTGKMKPVAPDAVKKGFEKSTGAMMAKVQESLTDAIAKEAKS
jgi:hypothetical protein